MFPQPIIPALTACSLANSFPFPSTKYRVSRFQGSPFHPDPETSMPQLLSPGTQYSVLGIRYSVLPQAQRQLFVYGRVLARGDDGQLVLRANIVVHARGYLPARLK